MNHYIADLLCLAGVALIGIALWMVHPALSLGGLGLFAVAAGVALQRRGRGKAHARRPD